jgi:hypothetical protein
MNTQHQESVKRLHLIEELRVAVNTIKSGLGILQQSVTVVDRKYFLFMLVLSTGLERYMKVLLCLQSLDGTGNILSSNELQNFGHNLISLNDAIADRCFTEEAMKRSAMRKDLEFIQEGELIGKILKVLSDFADASKDRYIYLEGANNPGHDRDWLDRKWESVEDLTMSRKRRLRLIEDGELDEIRVEATNEIVKCIERYLRALARTVTLTGYDGEVKSLGTDAFDFLMKRDDELGSEEYDIC